MSSKPKLRIRFIDGKMEVLGEVDNTTKTLMGLHKALSKKGVVFTEYEKGGEKEGMSLLATTLCG